MDNIYKKAYDFINQHRSQLTRENNATTSPVVQHPQSSNESHRGTVKHPDQDMRLKENKEKHDQETQQNEQQDPSETYRNDPALEDHDKMARERKLEELRKIEQHTATAGFAIKPKTVDPSGTFAIKPERTDLNPHVPENIARTSPSNVTPAPGQSKEEAALRANPKVGPYVNKALGPNPAHPEKLKKLYEKLHQASQELKNNPYYGSMVAGIFSTKNISAEQVKEVNEKLHKALKNVDNVIVSNSIHKGIAITAELLLEFKKNAK